MSLSKPSYRCRHKTRTLVEAEYGQGYFLCPGTVLGQAYPVARASKQLPSGHQVAVLGSLIIKA